jgi:hypothetical protein
VKSGGKSPSYRWVLAAAPVVSASTGMGNMSKRKKKEAKTNLMAYKEATTTHGVDD